jgi:integrase
MSTTFKRIAEGLYLRTQGTSKSYIFKYQFAGKRRELGVGSAKDYTVTAVKARVAKLRLMILEGIDPAEEIKKQKAKAAEKAAKVELTKPTFEEFAPQAIAQLKFLRNWRSPKNEAQWYSTMKTYVYPFFGSKEIDTVTKEDVLAALSPIWYRIIDTADKVQSRIEQIFNQAIRQGLCTNNPARWRDNLDADLPSKATVKKGRITKHHAAVSPRQLKMVVAGLRMLPDVSAKAVLYGILCAGRVNEFSATQWIEIDNERGIHNVPRRKVDDDGEVFKVPLSRQAREILEELPKNCKYVFSINGRTPICKDTPRKFLKRHCPWEITMHGCRSTFSDWCAEQEKNVLVSEKCLMHVGGDKVFRAYQRSDLMNQRRQLLQEWADFLWGEE